MSNNKKPLVSIILPSYNHAKYIKESIDSALNQTYKNIELIIVDDGSTDNSKEIILSYKDERIKSYFFNKNKGAVYATNFCIKHSLGEYISVLNSDDIYYPNKIKKQLNFFLKNKETSAVFSFAQAIDENSNKLSKNTALEPHETIKSNRTDFLKHFLHSGNILIHPTALIKKEVYKKIGFYDNRLHQIPDFEYWVRMCSLGYNIKVIPEKLIQYRFRDNELNTSNGNRVDVSNRLIFEYQFLLENYFNLKIEDIKSIFVLPDKYKNITNDDREFVIAESLLNYEHKGNLYKSVYKLTALNKLFEIIKNEKVKNYLEKKYNFSYPQLIEQTGEYLLFNPNNNNQNKIIYENIKIKNELEIIKKSKSWIIFKKIINFIFFFK